MAAHAHRKRARSAKPNDDGRIGCLRYHARPEPDKLLSQLAIHEVDLAISDAPLDPSMRIRAFSHLLGQSGVSFFAHPRVARQSKGRFPKCLDGMPFLMPAENTDLRRSLEHWFDAQGVRPMVVGEFEDSAMTVVFGEAAVGAFAAPTATETQVKRQYQLSGAKLPAQGESVDSQDPSTPVEAGACRPNRAETRMKARFTHGTSTTTTHHLYRRRASS